MTGGVTQSHSWCGIDSDGSSAVGALNHLRHAHRCPKAHLPDTQLSLSTLSSYSPVHNHNLNARPSPCHPSNNKTALPTQAEFLQNGIKACEPLSLDLEDTTCSVCIEPFTSANTDIVKLGRCGHCYFHEDCIVAWFNSTHERSGACPNDRTPLFQPDHVIAAQNLRQELLREIRRRAWDRGRIRHGDLVRAQESDMSRDEIVEAWLNDQAKYSTVRVEVDAEAPRLQLHEPG